MASSQQSTGAKAKQSLPFYAPKKEPESYGTRIRQLREKENLTQEALGKILNVSTGTISNYENQIHEPAIDTLVQMADHFHVSVDYLLGRTDFSGSYALFEKSYCHNISLIQIISMFDKLAPQSKESVTDLLQAIYLRDTTQKPHR